MEDKLDKALARIAALESQLSRQPKPEFDPRQFAQALTSDPVGTMTRMGVPVDYVSKLLVAHTLGDHAPAELRTLAMMGPQVSQMQAIASDLQAVRQRQEAIEERDRKSNLRTSFSGLATDKTKYPLLAAAFGKAPSLFSDEIESYRGNADELAAAIEGRLKVTAEAAGYTPPASDADADKTQGQSTQAKQAPGAVDQTPPPLSQAKPGVFTQEDHEALKQRIIRKYS